MTLLLADGASFSLSRQQLGARNGQFVLNNTASEIFKYVFDVL